MSSLTKVAELCHLSIATVSRVINNPKLVRPETVLAVEKAMLEANYRGKDRRYRFTMVEENRHYHLVFLVPDVDNRAMQTALSLQIYSGAFDVCVNEQHEILLSRLVDFSGESFRPTALPDGIIHKNQHSDIDYDSFYPAVPQVICNENTLSPEKYDMVLPDNEAIAEFALQYCREHQHKKVAVIHQKQDLTAQLRSSDVLELLNNSGILCQTINYTDSLHPENNLGECISNYDLVIPVGMDEVAIRLFSRLRGDGMRWFDKVDFLPVVANPETASMLSEYMSEISVNAHEIGKTAAEILLLRLRSLNNRKIKTLVRPDFIPGKLFVK